MKFWARFLNTRHIKYSIIGAFLGGIIFIILANIGNKVITDTILYSGCFLGFLMGNLYKCLVLENEEKKQRKKSSKIN